MSMRFVINLSDRDLNFFRKALKKSRDAVRYADEDEIIEAVADVLTAIKREAPLPDFVALRLPQLDSLMRMLRDDEWNLPKSNRDRLLAAFVYFGDPEDILPDHVPVIGYLDDVIMIELVVRELQHVIEAYDDFCRFRDEFRARCENGQNQATYRSRLASRRRQLHQRMNRRLANDKRSKKSTALW